MKHESLRKAVCAVNRKLVSSGLALLTFGNASGADRAAGVVAIKPSGVGYDELGPEEMVILDLATGAIRDGSLRPSSDTETHLALYRAFPGIGGVVHTHSRFATIFAQARRPVPCYGTTHADYFRGAVPVTRILKKDEVVREYEANTGRLIVEHFEGKSLDPAELPGVLVAGHGPFTWGEDAGAALEHALVLEEVACMAFETMSVRPGLRPLPAYLTDRHFLRKHGADAYYGQK